MDWGRDLYVRGNCWWLSFFGLGKIQIQLGLINQLEDMRPGGSYSGPI